MVSCSFDGGFASLTTLFATVRDRNNPMHPRNGTAFSLHLQHLPRSGVIVGATAPPHRSGLPRREDDWVATCKRMMVRRTSGDDGQQQRLTESATE